MSAVPANTELNAICPYFTMFPLEFPLRVLSARAKSGDLVLDPFSGRGTTCYASRLRGLSSIGIDSSPVAVALTHAKVANASPFAIVTCAETLLEQIDTPVSCPDGEFWDWAFHPSVLEQLCRLRQALTKDCRSHVRKALRAVLLGGLHGPQTKSDPSYFSNQCQRTYAPKPNYAVSFWKSRGTKPPYVNVIDLIKRRAQRYYSKPPRADGIVIKGDSRESATFESIQGRDVSWVVTSPPYYGLRTYIPDQWLRNWFVGGSSEVDYSNQHQLSHSSPETFSADLERVWNNVAAISRTGANMVIRFGGIPDRKADPVCIIKKSLRDTAWRITTMKSAGTASSGRRQAMQFATTQNVARTEYDVWARL